MKPLDLPARTHIRGVRGGTPHAAHIRRLAAIRGTTTEMMRDLEAAGMTYPGAYVRTSCANLDRAIEALAVLAERERPAQMMSEDGSVEHLTHSDGRGTGVYSKVANCGRKAERGVLDARGAFKADRDADASSITLEARDLGWELLNLDAARVFVEGDVAAALLARALSEVTWIHSDTRARWRASGQMADFLVKIIRSGRSAPNLVTSPERTAVDAAVIDLLAGMRWHPLPTVESYRRPACRGNGSPASDIMETEDGSRPTLQ